MSEDYSTIWRELPGEYFIERDWLSTSYSIGDTEQWKALRNNSGCEIPKMSENTKVSFNSKFINFLNFLLRHRYFHYEDFIKICDNVSNPTPTLYQQLEVSLYNSSKEVIRGLKYL